MHIHLHKKKNGNKENIFDILLQYIKSTEKMQTFF